MDFRTIFQLREKKFWWIDVIYYFAISMLLATLFCYVIFLVKNNMLRAEIEQKIAELKTVGTQDQKKYEQQVVSYQKKIGDFADIFKNHEFASRVFSFLQSQTMPNIWFSQFSLDRKNTKVQLLGETDNMEDLSRQLANFEKNEYVANMTALNSTLGDYARVRFNINLMLDSKLFSYVPESLQDISSAESIVFVQTDLSEDEDIFLPAERKPQKMITVFSFPLKPEVIGIIDQNNLTIELDVPFGTDITKLAPFIISSPGAVVSPGPYVAQDFTNPVIYHVAAKDGSSQNYTVTVNVLPQPTAQPRGKFGASSIFILLGIIFVIVSVIFGIFLMFKRKLIKNQEINNNEN